MGREEKERKNAIDFTILPSGKVAVVSRGGFPGLRNTSREVPAETVYAAERLMIGRRDVFVVHGN